MNTKLIILDRDGVINHDSDQYIKSPDEWIPLPGSLEAIAQLSHNGYRVVVATNQSGVGRGLFDMATLNAMHDKLHKLVQTAGGKIDAIFFCAHTNEDNCDCRKPKPGMFEQISLRYGRSLNDVPCVGDSLRDLEAGTALGCQPYLVQTGKGKKTEAKGGLPAGTQVFADLSAVVRHLLSTAEASASTNTITHTAA
jgi:D-glycero-D-manno-heptose 1,7-bisphosphate phosphatase